MNVAQMAIIAATIGQAAKEYLRRWLKLEGKATIVFMVIVSAGVVGYKFITEKLIFDLATFLILVTEVASTAVGGKLFIGSVAKKINK